MSVLIHRRHHIYKKYWHVFIVLGLIILPVIFFSVFSQFIGVSATVVFADIGLSLVRLLVAYSIATLLGWLLAVAFYRGNASTIALPLFDVLQSIPTFAALPLAILVWGKSDLVVIFFLILAIIWPIFFSVMSSLKMVKHEYEEVLQITGIAGWDRIKYFLLPASIPGIITGSIVGLGDAWEALIATEIIVGLTTGLGSFFNTYSGNSTITLFGILGLLMIIFSINKMIWLPLLEESHRHNEE
jgi:ABC-type nitrate/sulfonate/bicarbonate transport system permease component